MAHEIYYANDNNLRRQITRALGDLQTQITEIYNLVNILAQGGYLLQEDGFKLTLEDGTGFLLLEDIDGGTGTGTDNPVYKYKTADYTAVSGEIIFVDSSGGVITIDAPASPVEGDWFGVWDTGGAAEANNVTVDRNGSTIDGVAENYVLDMDYGRWDLMYDGTTWRFSPVVLGEDNNDIPDIFTVVVDIVANTDYVLWYDAPFAGTVTAVRTDCVSGTCTLTGKINTTALGGTANSVSTAAQEQVHVSSNTFAVGDKLQFTISSNSSCLTMSVAFYLTRTP